MWSAFDPAPLLAGLAACPAVFFLAVVVATLVLEDVTAVAVGALGAAMQVDPALGLAALLFGTVLGDLLLHAAGRLGRAHPWVVRRMAASPRVAALGRSAWVVAAARVVPGLRVPAYVGSGVAGMSPARFALVVSVTGLFWTPLLFLSGGALTGAGAWLGIAAIALLLPLGPRLVRSLRRA
jgi:membrane protein DedA with SNARE-associated domain